MRIQGHDGEMVQTCVRPEYWHLDMPASRRPTQRPG